MDEHAGYFWSIIIAAIVSAIVVVGDRIVGWRGQLRKQVADNIQDIKQLKERDDYTDRRVDLNNKSTIRRGFARARQTGLIKDDDMATLIDRVRKAYEPIAFSLREMRRQYPDLPDERFIEHVEERWGDWLNPHICIPLNVSEGECWAMALIVANEQQRSPV